MIMDHPVSMVYTFGQRTGQEVTFVNEKKIGADHELR